MSQFTVSKPIMPPPPPQASHKRLNLLFLFKPDLKPGEKKKVRIDRNETVRPIFLSAGHETAVRAGQVPEEALQELPGRGLQQQRGRCMHVEDCVCMYVCVCGSRCCSSELHCHLNVMRVLAPTCEREAHVWPQPPSVMAAANVHTTLMSLTHVGDITAAAL